MHKPSHLREALVGWLRDPERETVVVSGEGAPWRVDRLVGELWGSTDTMPAEVCEEAGLPRGCTYGHAVRLLAWVRDERVPDAEGYGAAARVLQDMEDTDLRGMFDTISDLLRAEDQERSRP